LELSGLTQGFKARFADSVVDSFISSGLIEDLHRAGSHVAFFCQVVQGVVQSAEGERPPGHLGDFIPDPDAISLVLEPPYGYQKNLFID